MSETKRDKRYNITGTIQNLEVKTAANGASYTKFELAREGQKPVKAMAFAEKAETVIAQMKKSPVAKLFGYFDKRSFTGRDGTPRTSQSFRVLWAGDPKAAVPAEGEGEAAAAA